MKRIPRLRVLSLAGAALIGFGAVLAAQNPSKSDPSQDPELVMGRQVYEELRKKGEIVEASPLYDSLMPVIEPIMKSAQPRYDHPFKVYLVHESQPNAFATPGGGIYVTDSLLYFVKNKEQLAGTLCHEVAHTIHHDSMELLAKNEKLEKRELAAAILLGPTRAHILAIALLGRLHGLGYSREAESRADSTGADLCAAAGSNPWGLVWLFQDFKTARSREIPQLLSDHPGDQARVDALEEHFQKDPAVFGRFSRDPASATPFTAPKNAQESFVR